METGEASHRFTACLMSVSNGAYFSYKNTNIFFGWSTNVHPEAHTLTFTYIEREKEEWREQKKVRQFVRLLPFVMLFMCTKRKFYLHPISDISIENFRAKKKQKLKQTREKKEIRTKEMKIVRPIQIKVCAYDERTAARTRFINESTNEWTKPHDE